MQSDYGSAGVGFIDGTYCAFSQLRVPVTDMGFQLSDLCYDAVHVWDGGFFRLPEHLDRWEQSVAARRYDSLGYDREAVAEVLHGCVARANLQRSMVTLVATRGTPTTARKDLRTCRNRLIAWALPYHGIVTDEQAQEGCDVIIARTERIAPEAVDPTVKNFSRLDFVGALFEAYERNADYAVLLDAEGNVTEGRGWNIFGLHGGELVTPERGVLEGITRATILELCNALNIKARRGSLSADALRAADEVFMTSTAGGIMPVRSIDGAPVGDGLPGPTTTRLREMYWDLHRRSEYMTPVRYAFSD